MRDRRDLATVEVVLDLDYVVTAPDGVRYRARACGRPIGHLWEGWVEMIPFGELDGVIRTGRETTQPNRTDLEYWAAGLTPIYLEGALFRATAMPDGTVRDE